MATYVYEDVVEEIEAEMDIQSSDTITAPMMKGFANGAIRDAASIIHDLFEGYFLTYDRLTTIVGQASYDMPENLYAQKIVKVVYSSQARKYEVIRPTSLLDLEDVSSGDDYVWNPESNVAGSGAAFVLYPTPTVAETEIMRRWFIRVPNIIVAVTDTIDIPQFIDFIKFHMKSEIAVIIGHPLLSWYMGERDKLEQRMRSTLSTMVLDGAPGLKGDLSFYDDFE